MNNETNIGVSFNNEVKNLDKLKEYEERLKNVYGLIDGLNSNKSKSAVNKISKNVNGMNKNVKEATISTAKLGNTLTKAFNVGKILMYTKSLYKLVQTLMKLSQKSVEYIENVNLLEVAYKNQNETIEESSRRIENYIDKMSEVYGLDESRLTRQFGIFKQLANAMQLPTETAENLSEIMVKMTNDIASLYNLDLNRASNALQSALAGQVRPIRSATGADITEKTLQNTVVDLGLDRSISQLSYVEKRLIMVISLTNQLKASQGDYARTIESASNQIRVMHEQWDRLSRAVGNVFYPILEKILPYINAILMALTELFNMIAKLVGFKMPKFDYSGLSGVSDVAMDIEEEMTGAGEATDKLANKLKGLRSFDKLNVINTPTTSSSASGSGGAGGIDPKIMDAFNDAFKNYNDMMDTVQMKATKIRDAIMEWLGFTKQVNEETGEISWIYDNTKIQIDGILSSLINTGSSVFELFKTIGSNIGTVLTSNITAEIFENIYQTLVNIIEIIGNIADAINNALKNGNGLKIVESYFKLSNNLWKIIKSITESIKKWTISSSFQTAVKNLFNIFSDIADVIVDIADWIANIYVEYAEPVVNDILELISETINAISAIWDVVEPIVAKIVDIIENFLGPILKRLFEWIDDIINILKDLMKFVSAVFKGDWEQAWKSIQDIFSGVVDFVVDSVMYVIDVFVSLWQSIWETFSGIGEWFKDIFKAGWDYVVEIWNGAGEWFTGIVGNIGKAFENGFNAIYDTVKSIWDTILELFNKGGKIFDGIVGGIADVFKTIVNALIDGINRVIAIPFNTINGLLNTIRNASFLGVAPFKGLWSENPLYVPQIPKLEIGGLPPVGQLFIANEKGPELVGQIGGQSFVANQNQMMDLLDRKIGNAQNKQPQIFNFYLDADHKIGTYTLDQLQELAKTNGQAITIG